MNESSCSRNGNSLEGDGELRESEEAEHFREMQDEELNWDCADQTDHSGTENTVRFEDMADTEGLTTIALEIGVSERDMSALKRLVEKTQYIRVHLTR